MNRHTDVSRYPGLFIGSRQRLDPGFRRGDDQDFGYLLLWSYTWPCCRPLKSRQMPIL